METMILNLGSRIVNIYMFQIEGGYLFVDTGYANNFKYFRKKLAKLQITPKDIKYIYFLPMPMMITLVFSIIFLYNRCQSTASSESNYRVEKRSKLICRRMFRTPCILFLPDTCLPGPLSTNQGGTS